MHDEELARIWLRARMGSYTSLAEQLEVLIEAIAALHGQVAALEKKVSRLEVRHEEKRKKENEQH